MNLMGPNPMKGYQRIAPRIRINLRKVNPSKVALQKRTNEQRTSNNQVVQQCQYRVRKDSNDAKSQLGAFISKIKQKH